MTFHPNMSYNKVNNRMDKVEAIAILLYNYIKGIKKLKGMQSALLL